MKLKPETIGSQLAALVKGDVHIDIYNRVAFSTDASIYQIFPQCVVSVRDEEDIRRVIQYAREKGLSVAARGAGSGVAGESLTDGIVIDVRRYMDRILSVSEDGEQVTVQPGVVLDDLNRFLAPYGRMIGPDPSSSNRAVIGGCLANNATGAHSLVYGHFDRWVQRVRAVLADGTVVELVNGVKPNEDNGPESKIAGQCFALLSGKESVIRAARRKTERNRSGYAIDGIVHDGVVDLARLTAGSEGTLAVFTEITLRTVPVPRCKGLVQLEFPSFETMARAIPLILRCGPAACELMDQGLMTMARQAYPKYRDVLPEGCAAALLVEMTGTDENEVHEKLQRVRLSVADLAVRAENVLEESRQQRLWKARKDAVPLLNRQKGPAHPIPFIEDVSVDPVRLDEYIAGLEKIGRQYGITMAYYGHAGDGGVHIRPYIDLSREEGVRQMRAMAEEVFELAWSMGGSVSGEHADGLVRAAFIRRQYGDAYYELLKGVKRIFDPEGILNPGKILNEDPDVMVRHLRLPGGDLEGKTALLLGPEEFRFEAEQCSGCGVCLARTEGARMCPVFRAVNEELASSRAKANLLRSAAALPPEVGTYEAQGLREVLSLCVNCKMCSVQCPAGVDVSKLVIEARAQLARKLGFSAAQTVLSRNRLVSSLAAAFAPLSNWILQIPLSRLLMEKTLGLDRHRAFPKFERGSFIRKAQRFRRPAVSAAFTEKAAYFVDSFANWNDHSLGFAVVGVLEKLGVQVEVPLQRPAPLPAYVYGNLRTARRDLEYNLKQFVPLVQKGYEVVCSEPSAALCLKEEMKYLIQTQESSLLADQTWELMGYIRRILEHRGWGLIPLSDACRTVRYAYHAPCHLQALRQPSDTVDLLDRLGLKVVNLNGGCCGLAGTAGMQSQKAKLSEAIGESLKKKIEQVNPDIVLTECAACAMQIEHLTGRKTLHPIKLLWEYGWKE
ncbi:MAG: FAD-linked oxidase C-terminal domain-containing protein [Anaerohalosphaeraceae bacterium]